MDNKIINVGIDLDGVCANFSKAFSVVANRKFGKDKWILKSKDQILAWDWTEWYPITKDEVKELWGIVRDTNNFWMTLEVMDYIEFVCMRRVFM